MGAESRRKGAAGEREVAEGIRILLGVQMRRRLSQYQRAGECDLEPADGNPLLAGHAIEVKRAKAVGQGAINTWWKETVAQAGTRKPVLWFRADGSEWRVRCRMTVCGYDLEPVITPAEWAAVVHGI